MSKVQEVFFAIIVPVKLFKYLSRYCDAFWRFHVGKSVFIDLNNIFSVWLQLVQLWRMAILGIEESDFKATCPRVNKICQGQCSGFPGACKSSKNYTKVWTSSKLSFNQIVSKYDWSILIVWCPFCFEDLTSHKFGHWINWRWK